MNIEENIRDQRERIGLFSGDVVCESSALNRGMHREFHKAGFFNRGRVRLGDREVNGVLIKGRWRALIWLCGERERGRVKGRGVKYTCVVSLMFKGFRLLTEENRV